MQQGPPPYGPYGYGPPAAVGPKSTRTFRLIGLVVFLGGTFGWIGNILATYVLAIWFPIVAVLGPPTGAAGLLMLAAGPPVDPATGAQRIWWWFLLAGGIFCGLLVGLVTAML